VHMMEQKQQYYIEVHQFFSKHLQLLVLLLDVVQ